MQTETPQPVAAIAPRILATLASPSAQPITVPLPDNAKRRRWLDRWIRLNAYRPELRELEDKVYDFCRGFSKTPGKGYRLILHGENGTGKSHVTKAICRWAARNAIQMPLCDKGDWLGLSKARYVLWPEAVTAFKQGRWEMLDDLESCELLAIDDLGAEHDPTAFSREKIYWLLERRDTRWTIITTNISPENWAARLERRIASRLFRNSKIVALDKVLDYSGVRRDR